MTAVAPPLDVAQLGEDPRDWDGLVRTHWDAVYGHVLRLTRNRADAQDLTQDAFVRAFRAAERFEAGSVRAWLKRIATNLFLDSARRRSRIRFEPLTEDVARSTVASAETTALDGMLAPRLESALRTLPEPMRAVLVLRHIEGRSDAQIAVQLGIDISTVRTRSHRARARMRDALGSPDRATRTPPVDRPVARQRRGIGDDGRSRPTAPIGSVHRSVYWAVPPGIRTNGGHRRPVVTPSVVSETTSFPRSPKPRGRAREDMRT
jgi:RNA polymerase sigma factor (sigma-70 family)